MKLGLRHYCGYFKFWAKIVNVNLSVYLLLTELVLSRTHNTDPWISEVIRGKDDSIIIITFIYHLSIYRCNPRDVEIVDCTILLNYNCIGVETDFLAIEMDLTHYSPNS